LREDKMRKMFFSFGLVVLLVSLSAAQDSAAAPKTSLPFCPPNTCLYYSGDFDASNRAAYGLINVNSLDTGVAEVWVAVKPTRNVTVTGVTFHEAFNSIEGDINPTPFQINTGMSVGNGGQKFCTSKGSVTIKPYGGTAFGLNQYSFTIKKLTPSCKLKKGRVYYLNLLPTYRNSNYGYLLDVEDRPAPNHRGWPNVWDASYYWALNGDINYWPTWGNSGVCGGVGCDLFSFALTGTKQ
jgi:hypothetical protein